MGFRTVVIQSPCKLTYKDGFLVIRGDEMNTVHLSEIHTFHIELNSRKNLNALYARLDTLLHADLEQYAEWTRLFVCLSDIKDTLCRQLPCAISANDELSLAEYCKGISLAFDESTSLEPIDRIYALLDIAAEFFPAKLLVLCNISTYLSEEKRNELLKYVCYLKLCILFIDGPLSENKYEHEIRWIIDENFDDEIVGL